ncbi:MAG: hypothetical protein R2705_14405 [Ilumatobacteraceae bacterium]
MHAGTSGIGGSIKVEQCNGTRCAPLAGARLVITPTPQACVTLAPLPEACVKALNSDQSIIEMRRRRFSRRRRRVRFAVVLDGEGRLRRALDVPTPAPPSAPSTAPLQTPIVPCRDSVDLVGQLAE